MDFKSALEAMKHGEAVKLPPWGGFWRWDAEKRTIIMHTKEGKEMDIRETQVVEYTLLNVLSDEWVIAGLENGRVFWKPFFNFPCVFNGLRRQEIKRKSGFLSKFLSFFRETLEREYIWRCTQAVEGNGLENREVGVENRRGGSNPSISASQSKVRFALIFYLPHQEITFKAPCKPLVIAAAESRLELHSKCA